MATAIMGNYQIIFKGWPDTQKILLFDLAEDPKAENNLAGDGLELEAMLSKLLHNALVKLEESSKEFQGKQEKVVDKEELERLRSLGYIH